VTLREPFEDVGSEQRRRRDSEPWTSRRHCRVPGSLAPSERPHSAAAKAGSLGKAEGGLSRSVIAGRGPVDGGGSST
jgi:hypothetical protein